MKQAYIELLRLRIVVLDAMLLRLREIIRKENEIAALRGKNANDS
jgi:hypothetical protein